MYNVATILPLWVNHFQHTYHHSSSPTRRCPARLFLRKMLFLDVTPCTYHPSFYHIVPPNLILCYWCPHEFVWQNFIILESHLPFSSHKFQEGASEVWMRFQIGKFLGKLQNVLIKKPLLLLVRAMQLMTCALLQY